MPTRSSELAVAHWRKSSFTSGGNDAQCVELAWIGLGGAVRDSKENGGGYALVIGSSAFRTFLGAAKTGSLDA
ncbi:DUF397 domain-containing protein [Actinokineospora sp.]|uniref:DUF397 domain-containing protein n=1 Tax=Actinokineospora sp. TaxID=1872133 RepID=UPI003D6A58F6